MMLKRRGDIRFLALGKIQAVHNDLNGVSLALEKIRSSFLNRNHILLIFNQNINLSA